MKKIFYKILLFLFVLVAQSCVPEDLEVESVPEAESKLVVSTILVPDSTIVLALTQSFGALEGGEESDPEELLQQVLVPGAEVQVKFGGETVSLVESSDGLYVSTEVMNAENIDYILSIYDPASGRAVQAVTELKEGVSFDTVYAFAELNTFDTFPEIHYQFSDPVGENWYMINVEAINEELISESFIDNQPYTYLIDHNSMQDGGIISGDFVALHNEEYEIGDTLIVSLSNISQAYYDYLKTREDERLAIDFLSEPFNLPTNVSGGYGFFNLHVPDPRVITMEKE